MSVSKPAIAAALLAAASAASGSVLVPQVALPGKSIPKYVDPLPVFGPVQPGTAGTPAAALPRVPAACPAPAPGAPPAPGCSAQTAIDGSAIQVRDVRMKEFQQRILPAAVYPPAFAGGTWVWGYQVGDAPPLYPGVTLEATKGTPAWVRFVNEIPARSVLRGYLTVDQTIHWADPFGVGCMAYMNVGAPGAPAYPPPCLDPYAGPLPTVAHLHGGETPGEFDGGPEQWWTSDGSRTGGLYRSYVANQPNAATYGYPNQQPATTLWFHDHALGSTRLNVYAGLAAFYLVRDDAGAPGAIDTGVQRAGGLPAGPYEREIVIQDRQFDTNGQLLFPDGAPAGLNGPPTNPLVHPFWNPEFIGDVIVVNGKSWPYLDVEPRRYRFRFLNGSNARMYQMALANASGGYGPPFWQIGTDGGLLAAPVMLNDPAPLNAGAVQPQFLLAPGERADVIVDFSGLPPGTTLVLRNSARAPFTKGAPADPQTVGQIMQFRVRLPLAAGGDTSCAPPACTLRTAASPLHRLVNADGTLPAAVVPDLRRQLILREVAGPGGPLEVLLNNTKWMGLKESTIQPMPMPDGTTMAIGQAVDGSSAMVGPSYVTEAPRVSATEEWEIINTTADAHPIHVHLVQFQLLNRQPYQANAYLSDWSALLLANGKAAGDGPPNRYDVTTNRRGVPVVVPAGQPPIVGGNIDVTPYLQQSPTGPLPREFGWKDTVVMYPGQVTRILVRYTPQTVVPGTSAAGTSWSAYGSTWSPERPYGKFAQPSPGYVWHCHILDHEDNEMMRPMAVVP